MKISSVFFLVLTSVCPGSAADLCATQPKSCINLPQSSAKACSSFISKAGMKLTTCSKPKSTITKTATLQPSTTQIVTVTQTVSSIVASNIQRTVKNTITSTTVSHTTAVNTSTSTAHITIVVPETSTVTQGITTTTTSTSSVPYQSETCAVVTPVIRKRQRNYKALDIVPRDCSCYLTTTTTCGQSTTTTTVTRLASTAFVTQLKVTTVIKYSPKTSDVLQTTTAVVSAVSTDFSTIVVAITETQSITSVVATTTTTTTSTVTAVETAEANPCDNPSLYTSTRPDYPGAVWGIRKDSYNVKDCCQTCFRSNAGCLFYKWYNQICEVYVIPNKNDAVSCTTKSCRKGRPTLVSAAGDGSTYGVGICAASGFNG